MPRIQRDGLFPEEDPSSAPERVRRHMLARGLHRAARVIAVSEATKRDAVTHPGLSPDRIEVVHNAIDEQVGWPGTDNERIEVLHRYQILYEGFGLPPLEAMAHGTPVIPSNLSSMPEAVGDAAVLVNPENVFEIARGLQRVLLDETLREQLRRRGREQAARFSWDQSARHVLAIYHQVRKDQYHVRIQRTRAE